MTYVWTPGPQHGGLFKPLDQAEFDAMETWAQNHVQAAAGGPVHVDRNLWHPVCVAEIDRLLIERAGCVCGATFIPEDSTPDLRVYRRLGHEEINPLCPIHGSASREPSDDDIYNRVGVEGGIGYGPDDEPGSLGEHDWRL